MKKEQSAFWSFVGENLLSLLTVIAGAGVIVWQAVSATSPLDPMMTATLGLICLLATSEIVESRRRLARIQETMDTGLASVLAAVPAARIRRFASSEDALIYHARRLADAKYNVDQASIDLSSRSRVQQAREIAHAARETLISEGKVRYRYLFRITDERANNVKRWLTKAKLGKLFVVGITADTQRLPLPVFTIYDEEEVFVRSPYEVGEEEVYLSISHPDFVALFRQWFDRLWLSADRIDPKLGLEAQLAQLETLQK